MPITQGAGSGFYHDDVVVGGGWIERARADSFVRGNKKQLKPDKIGRCHPTWFFIE